MLQRISEKLIFRNKPNLLFLLRLILQTDSFFITVSKSMIFENMEMKSGVSTRSISRLEQGVSGPVSSGFRCGKPGMNIQIIWGNIRFPEIFK